MGNEPKNEPMFVYDEWTITLLSDDLSVLHLKEADEVAEALNRLVRELNRRFSESFKVEVG